MFSRKPKTESHALDETINQAVQGFAGIDDGSEEQLRAAQALKTLMEARIADKEATRGPTVSPDAIIAATSSLIGIIAILGFEKANVVTSKALSFVPRPKF